MRYAGGRSKSAIPAQRVRPEYLPRLVAGLLDRSVQMLDSALALRNGRRVRVVTTLERVTNKSHRELMDRVTAGWQRDTTFEATIGDGELSVWSERRDALTREPGRK